MSKMNRKTAVLNANPGLAAAFGVEHRIIQDIASRFAQNGYISDKQIALVMKLAAEARNPRPAEKTVTAPVTEERVTFRAQVVSAKSVTSQYGTSVKMTVKVPTADGVWLAWGTVPSSLLEQVPCGEFGRLEALRGAQVELTTSLKPGREQHFALLSRPTGKLINLRQNEVHVPVAAPVEADAAPFTEARETEVVTGEPATIEF